MLGVTLKRACKTAAAWALPFLLGTVMASAQQKPAAEEPSIDMQWAVKIPARDGVKLNATVFTPHDQKGPLPVIFTFTRTSEIRTRIVRCISRSMAAYTR